MKRKDTAGVTRKVMPDGTIALIREAPSRLQNWIEIIIPRLPGWKEKERKTGKKGAER